METGRVEWPLSAVNIDDALSRAAAVSKGIASEAGVRLALSLNAPGVVAEAEADRLVQVFVNLINNAIKYGATSGGAIEIESAFTDGRYRMTVADSGPGISERDRERVFEKFVRGAQPETSGAGLGLPISREIIRQFSGDLVLLDGPEGVGAVFQVTLPASLRAAAAE
jgi:signal transduction histidine kinase